MRDYSFEMLVLETLRRNSIKKFDEAFVESSSQSFGWKSLPRTLIWTPSLWSLFWISSYQKASHLAGALNPLSSSSHLNLFGTKLADFLRSLEAQVSTLFDSLEDRKRSASEAPIRMFWFRPSKTQNNLAAWLGVPTGMLRISSSPWRRWTRWN